MPIHIGVLVVCLEGLLMGFTRVHITLCPPSPLVRVFEYMHVSALFLFRYVSERVSVVVFYMIVCMYILCSEKSQTERTAATKTQIYCKARARAKSMSRFF